MYKSYVKHIIMKIVNLVQYEIPKKEHENHQSQIGFKVYVCHVQTKVYIHIQTLRVHKRYMHEGKWLKDVYLSLIHI